MIRIREIAVQTVRNILAHKLRSFLTMFGIAWGIASVVLMIAIGDGFKVGYREQLKTLGTDIVIIWGGRTTEQVGDQRAGRPVRLTYEDVLAIQRECYLIKHVTPELTRSLEVKSAHNAGVFTVDGVAPIFQEIRSQVVAEGRLLNEADFQQARAVCVIGDEVKKQLFADRRAVGEQIRIADIPFLIVGELQHKDQNSTYNDLDGRKVLIPYTTMARHFPLPRADAPNQVSNIIVVPRSAEQHDDAIRQVRKTLGRRHGFAVSDEGALWMWDTVEDVRLVGSIFEAMQLFLGFIAVVTLSLGGVGVMNIMLVSVAERTREIGVKKAIGATRRRILLDFFLESLALSLTSGLIGLAFAWSVSALVARMPLPAFFAGFPITRSTAVIAFLTLVAVGIASAIYPARRASLLSPVEALRYE
ncbi:MAG TPA: ABC transporter permease [Candidatus Acidoferrales bacterium]|nr:ABC transporter permease [Candidatus Acidoferrales bacterium]